MHRRRTWFVPLLGLSYLAAGVAILAAQESVKPPPTDAAPRKWTSVEARRARELEEQVRRLTASGSLSEAVKTAEELSELFKKGLGPDHWRAVDARWDVEALKRVLKRGAASQKAFAGLRGLRQRAAPLEARGRFREALPLREEALATARDLFGDEYPDTATDYNNLAANLNALGRYAEAEKNLRKALGLRRKLLGEGNPGTALGYNNLAVNLSFQNRFPEAEDNYLKALARFRKLFNDTHPLTVNAYESLGHVLAEQSRYREAERCYRIVLTVYRRLRGEEDLKTVDGYHNLALALLFQGIYGEAEEHCRKALALRLQLLGEDHLDTAESYRVLATILHWQMRYAEAEPICTRHLALCRKLRGEGNLDTAASYSMLADNLYGQERYADAEKACRTALALFRKLRGEEHLDTAGGYVSLVRILHRQERYAEAETLIRRSLKLYDKLLEKAGTDKAVRYNISIAAATGYNNLAANLGEQGRHAEAEKYCRDALGIRSRLLGEEHPSTVNSYNALALNLYRQGQYAKAEEGFRKAADAFEGARYQVAAVGLERAAFSSSHSPLPILAALLARNGKPEDAWLWLERSLARGTADDLRFLRRLKSGDRERRAALARRLTQLDALIRKSAALKAGTEAEKKKYDALLAERRRVQDDLSVIGRALFLTAKMSRAERLEELAMIREAQRVYGSARPPISERAAVQAALPADTALVVWVDFVSPNNRAINPEAEHWAALLRARGTPTWVRLKGSGRNGAWTEYDYLLPGALRAALESPKGAWRPLAEDLRRQRLDVLKEHLAAGDGRPAVRRLIVLPSPALAGVPIEVLTDDLTVSYVHSATMYAQQRQERPATGKGLLALADPAYEGSAAGKKPKPGPRSPGGLLVTVVAPGSRAAAAGLKPGDVLLRYGGADMAAVEDLSRQVAARAAGGPVTLALWREGKTSERRVPAGDLGVAVASAPAPVALAGKRTVGDGPAAPGGDEGWPPLPGTRAEVAALGRLFADARPAPILLTGLDASEKKLDELAGSEALGGFRYLHLATHGIADDHFPLRSAVILALDDPNRPDAGRLPAEKILRTWQLHTDLVTLSACQTALGKHEVGEGFIGFAQALILAGSRSVCLSLWKVDDTATALFMERFYQNLLGRRDGLKGLMKKAAALAEAKAWLRNLSRGEALKRAESLSEGVARGKGRKMLPLLPALPPPAAGVKEQRPYAHPYYWAAFVLIGNSD